MHKVKNYRTFPRHEKGVREAPYINRKGCFVQFLAGDFFFGKS